MIATAIVLVVAVAAVMYVAWSARRRLEEQIAVAVARAVDEMQQDIVARQKSLDRQHKISVRNVARMEHCAGRVIDESRKVQDQSKSLHLQVQQVLCDPKIQAVLSRAEGVS